MGAAGDDQSGAGGHAQLAEHCGNVEHPTLIQPGRVKFQAAHHLDRFRAATQLAKPGGDGRALRADPGEGGEQRSKEKAESPVPAVGSVRETGVDQEQRNSLIAQPPDKVGPDFRLDQNNRFGVNHAQRPVHAFTVIDRVINLVDV